MSLKEQLLEAVAPFLMKEGLDSSKEIIAQNSTSFDEMGMANTNPGEFSQEEITDKENLINTGKMSNDTDFENKEEVAASEEEPSMGKLLDDLVKLGKHDRCENDAECTIAGIIESYLKKKQGTLTESDYAGNLSYNPDKRLNPSDVLNAVKNAVDPELSAKLSIVKNVDANEEPSYAIQNIDEKDLPEKLEIDTNTDKKVVLKKDGNSYKFDK